MISRARSGRPPREATTNGLQGLCKFHIGEWQEVLEHDFGALNVTVVHDYTHFPAECLAVDRGRRKHRRRCQRPPKDQPIILLRSFRSRLNGSRTPSGVGCLEGRR